MEAQHKNKTTQQNARIGLEKMKQEKQGEKQEKGETTKDDN
jgi:hypothetical protein